MRRRHKCGNSDHVSASSWHAHDTVAQEPTSHRNQFLCLIHSIDFLSSTVFLAHRKMGVTKPLKGSHGVWSHTSISYVSSRVLLMRQCTCYLQGIQLDGTTLIGAADPLFEVKWKQFLFSVGALIGGNFLISFFDGEHISHYVVCDSMQFKNLYILIGTEHLDVVKLYD